VTTLDELVDRHGLAPDVVKIDVEGHEAKVLVGAERTIERFRPRLIVEVHPSELRAAGEHPSQIAAWLSERGYHIRTFADHRAAAISPLIDAQDFGSPSNHSIVCVHRSDVRSPLAVG
jgi:hypothetical protein